MNRQRPADGETATTPLPDWCYRFPLHGLRLQAAEREPDDRPGATGTTTGDEPTLKLWSLPWVPEHEPLPLWQKEDRGERYHSLLRLYRGETGLLLKIDCEGKGVFHYRPQGIGIHWERQGTGPAHYLQTLGVALWLELRGVPCIHANALATSDGAIGLIAPSRTGKTTLTAALLQSGMRMLTDDMLALHRRGGEWRASPGWPRFRMWPDTARHYAGRPVEQMERVHERFDKRIVELETNNDNRFCDQGRPLKQLYLLERREAETGEIQIQPVPPGEALLQLLRNGILADAVEPLGLERARLGLLAELVEQVGFSRIRYPSGMQHLEALCERIREHQATG